jgi:DNA polymerase III delta subunit
MVLPQELIDAIKQRASEQGLSITAYVAELVRRDLGWPSQPDPRAMEQQLQQLQVRVEQLERQHGGL